MKGDKSSYPMAQIFTFGPVVLILLVHSFGDCARLPKIVGGSDAQKGEIPYQVSIQADNSDNRWVPVCGGSILNEYTILTAAHCIRFGPPDHPAPFRIVAGENNLDVSEGTEQFREVKQIVLHGDWDEFTYQNDVALFMISPPLEFNDFVQPIALPPAKHTSSGEGVVTGWGTDGENSAIRNILQKLEIPIFPASRCREVYGDDFSTSMICAGNQDGGGDACKGDSGGPLVASDLGYKYVAGTVSWGIGCGRPGYLGVYTQVSHFTSWIQYAIKANKP